MAYIFDLFFLILIPGCFYLSTLAPSIGYLDSPEFVDTSFALGISHPAGFPAYNLIAKAITFLPLGSIAFRVNLFSALFACMTLSVLYLSAIQIIKICFPESDSESRIGPDLSPPALLAFSSPFWFNSFIADIPFIPFTPSLSFIYYCYGRAIIILGFYSWRHFFWVECRESWHRGFLSASYFGSIFWLGEKT
jgi:hypothetical protein